MMERRETGQNLGWVNVRPTWRVQLAHLVYHHSQRITVRFASWMAIGTEARWIQQLRAHPTRRPSGGFGGFRQEHQVQIGHGHAAETANTSSARVINKDMRLFPLSAGQNVRREHRTYPFEISVNDLEAMNVCHTRHGPRELSAVGEKEGTDSKQQVSLPIVSDSPLGWILRTASNSR